MRRKLAGVQLPLESFFDRPWQKQTNRKSTKRAIDPVDEHSHEPASKKLKCKENIYSKENVDSRFGMKPSVSRASLSRKKCAGDAYEVIDLTGADYVPLSTTTYHETVVAASSSSTPLIKRGRSSAHALPTPPSINTPQKGVYSTIKEVELPPSFIDPTVTPAHRRSRNLPQLPTPGATPITRPTRGLLTRRRSSSLSSSPWGAVASTHVVAVQATHKEDEIIVPSSQVLDHLLSSPRPLLPSSTMFTPPEVKGFIAVRRTDVRDAARAGLLDDGEMFVPSSQTQELSISPARSMKSLPSPAFHFNIPLAGLDYGEIVPSSQSQERDLEIVPTSQSQERELEIVSAPQRLERQLEIVPTSQSQERELEIVPTSQSQEMELDVYHHRYFGLQQYASTSHRNAVMLPRSLHEDSCPPATVSTDFVVPVRHPSVAPESLGAMHDNSYGRQQDVHLFAESLELVQGPQSQDENELDISFSVLGQSSLCAVEEGNIEHMHSPLSQRNEIVEIPNSAQKDRDQTQHTSQSESQPSSLHSSLCTSPPRPPISCESSWDIENLDQNLELEIPPEFAKFRDMFNEEPSFLQSNESIYDYSTISNRLASRQSVTQEESQVEDLDRGMRSESVTEPESDDFIPPTRRSIHPEDGSPRRAEGDTTADRHISANTTYDMDFSLSFSDPLSIPETFEEGTSISSASFEGSMPAVARDFLEMFSDDSQTQD